MSDQSTNNESKIPSGDFAQALRGEIKLTVGALLERAWNITLRSLPWMLGIAIGLYALNTLLAGILAFAFPVDMEAFANQENVDWEALDWGNLIVSSLLQEIILAPFAAMLVFVGMLNAAERKPSMLKLRGVFTYAPKLMLLAAVKLAAMALSAAIVGVIFMFISSSLAMILIVLTVMYVQLVSMLAIPLIIDRELGVMRALIASFLVINKAMFPVLAVMALMIIVLMISAIPMLLGLIFTLPMAFNLIGVIYHSLIGVSEHA